MKIREGSISWGTLRPQDLLRAFADEYQRLLPFNGVRMADEARDIAQSIDDAEQSIGHPSLMATLYDDASEMIDVLTQEFNRFAETRGFYFGTTEGDGSDFGFWRCEDDEE